MLRHACLSDPGRHHEENQDRCFIDAEQGLFLISDGMAEAVSPQLVVDRLPGRLREALTGVADLSDPQAAVGVKAAVADVSAQVRDERRKRGGMLGATLVLALVRGRQALLAHLGDSRIYLFRGGTLEQLTRDHSHLMRMVDLGRLTLEEAEISLGNGGPTRFMGMPEEADAEVRCLDLAAGDRLLLCSDGLSELVRKEQLQPLLDPRLNADEACQGMIAAANAAGGFDNISAMVIEVD
jgi:protein phosphatase